MGVAGSWPTCCGAPTRLRFEQTRRKRVAEVLELCGIADIAHVPAARLPLGKARMAEMARAIVDHPRVLLLDEPTSGLEESEVENFGQTIHAVRAEEGCAVVLIEHDVGFVMRHSDRVIALNLGAVLADAAPDAVRNDPAGRRRLLRRELTATGGRAPFRPATGRARRAATSTTSTRDPLRRSPPRPRSRGRGSRPRRGRGSRPRALR